MAKTLPPQVKTALKEATVFTFFTIISVVLARFGSDPLSLFLRAYFTFLFTTVPGISIFVLVIAYFLVRKFINSRRGR